MASRETFNRYVDEFDKSYYENPDKTLDAMAKALNDLTVEKSTKTKNKKDGYDKSVGFGDIDTSLLITILLCVYGALLGFANVSESTFTWIFGYIFFIAGFFVAYSAKGFGIIFLFSHGMTGLGLMNAFLIGEIIKNPMVQDNGQAAYYYIGFVIALYVVATFLTILINLSDNMKKKKNIVLLPLGIYTLGFTLISILPHILDKVCAFNI